MRPVRRVITGHDRSGKSVVLFDDRMGDGSSAAVNVWGNLETPAGVAANRDMGREAFQLNPPPGGAVMRIAEIMPDPPMTAGDEEAKRSLIHDRLNAMGGPGTVFDQSRHWGMHRTRSVDYIVLLSGRLTMILDEGEVELEPFDVVVQRGTHHSWSNRGSEPAVLLVVMVDAVPIDDVDA